MSVFLRLPFLCFVFLSLFFFCLQDVPNVGSKGELVRVRPGFARNYLVPQGLALPVARESSLRRAQGWTLLRQQNEEALDAARRAALAAARGAEEAAAAPSAQDEAQAAVDRLISTPIVVKRKADADGQLSKPAGPAEVVDAVARQLRIDLDPKLLEIGDDAIKETGEFLVTTKIRGSDGKSAKIELHVLST